MGWAALRLWARGVRRNPLRSVLGMLGVAIGVCAVVATVSVGNGARAQVLRTLASLDSNRLDVVSNPRLSGVRRKSEPYNPDGLSVGDYLAIRREVRGISAATVLAFATSSEVLVRNSNIRFSTTGIDVEGFQVLSRRIIRGTFFGELDVRDAAAVAVIPRFLEKAMFEGRDGIGKYARVLGVPFLVIGIMEDDPKEWSGERVNDATIFVPYTSVLRRLDRTAGLSIVASADDPRSLEAIQRDIGNLLERRRGTRTAVFSTSNVAEVVRRQNSASRTLTLLLGGIGSISMLVGGVGIMNIMLANVAERVREIGIRLSVGTRPRRLLTQFLLEAALTSGVGGAIGVVLGVGAVHALPYLFGWPTQITPKLVAGSFVFSVAVGIIFGYYPSQRAARLDPVEALRVE